MIKHYNIFIFGRVQGVNFRYHGKIKAEKLMLTGWIRNEPDGSVKIEAEGSQAALAKFLDWCKSGPSFAQVAKLEVKEGAMVGYSNFEVRY